MKNRIKFPRRKFLQGALLVAGGSLLACNSTKEPRLFIPLADKSTPIVSGYAGDSR